MTQIKIRHGALVEAEVRGETKIVLQGVLEAASMHAVRYADYQRELFPATGRANIMAALVSGHWQQIPPVVLGIRSQRFHCEGETYYLEDEAWCIDGQQRIGTAIEWAGAHPHVKSQLLCVLHFQTNEVWERELFHALNAFQKDMSPNVLLHNVRDQYRPILTLFGLSNQAGFVLHDRVCWQQAQQRKHLITAMVCLKVMANLHSHLSPGRYNNMKNLLPALVALEAKLGTQHLRDNTAQFWNLIDECWGVRKIEYRKCAPHLNAGFLITLARILSDHSNFWRLGGKQLFVDADMRRKIGQQIKMEDDEIRRLSGAGGASLELLYEIIKKRINSGKRLHALKPWQDTVESRSKRGRPAEHAAAPQ